MKSRLFTATLMCAAALSLSANTVKQKIFINDEVTTHIVMPETIKMVDLSTTKIIGNQCTDNIVRIKPFIETDPETEKPIEYGEGDVMGTLTIIGERHMAHYDVIYTKSPARAASIFHVDYACTVPYNNPDVLMSKAEMARYAWAVYGSRRRYNQVFSNANGMKAILNNIYSVGDYFFIDYSLQNKTKIPYDIAEMRIKLTDKKELKATNSQSMELTPAFSLNNDKRFKKYFRNVLVIPKLTFPEEKVLKLEISENQISGRVITLTIEYDDILNADGFDSDILKNLPSYTFYPHLSK